MASANLDPVEAIAMTDLALKDVPEAKDTETALIAKEVDIEGGRAGPESKSKAEDEKGKANEMNIDYPNLFQAVSSADLLYIMPQRVGHASLGNLRGVALESKWHTLEK